MNQFVENFMEKPKDYMFKVPFGDFDSYEKIDNQCFCDINAIQEKINFVTLSQYLLKIGKKLFNDYFKNQTLDIDNIIFDKRYIEFKYGITLFNQ